MKSTLLSIILLSVTSAVYGQLKVYNSGNTLIGTKNSAAAYVPKLEVGSLKSGNSVAILGIGKGQNQATTVGVYGEAIDYNGCHNYGVVGGLGSGTQGTGIGGIAGQPISLGINGQYAGYFVGPVQVSGTLTANTIVQSSDIRLKTDVKTLTEYSGSALNKLKNMSVISYSYKNAFPSLLLPDTISENMVMETARIKAGKKHIGLIAQELRELYPELVEESQDGHLSVNYIELVPVLIQAIQELEQELDEIKGVSKAMTRSVDDETAEPNAVAIGNKLYQNTPNPFKEQTTIRFQLADGVNDAAICIFDMTGKTLKKLPISSGMESVSIGGWELGEGMFLYSLIVNGQEIDTKKMIITR